MFSLSPLGATLGVSRLVRPLESGKALSIGCPHDPTIAMLEQVYIKLRYRLVCSRKPMNMVMRVYICDTFLVAWNKAENMFFSDSSVSLRTFPDSKCSNRPPRSQPYDPIWRVFSWRVLSWKVFCWRRASWRKKGSENHRGSPPQNHRGSPPQIHRRRKTRLTIQ